MDNKIIKASQAKNQNFSISESSFMIFVVVICVVVICVIIAGIVFLKIFCRDKRDYARLA